ncbi:hypothetical protein [Sporosarcina sp. SG10008]|uniref:hypothetical protein n=1 Tax=Sporosarcina sp. SG10008 TaxID=3373103 RepID=UPI0037DC1E4F
MKKTLILGLSTMLTLGSLGGTLAPSAHASENPSNEVREALVSTGATLTNDASSSILEVAPYVHKNDQGLLYVDNNIPRDVYIENNVEELEKQFERINTQVRSGQLTINDDLSITSNQMTTFASKGYTSEKFWWGEKATYTNAQTKAAVKSTNAAGFDTALIGAGTLFLPFFGVGFAAVSGVTSAYLFNLANDMDNANKGRGIILNMTWALVYTTESR